MNADGGIPQRSCTSSHRCPVAIMVDKPDWHARRLMKAFEDYNKFLKQLIEMILAI